MKVDFLRSILRRHTITTTTQSNIASFYPAIFMNEYSCYVLLRIVAILLHNIFCALSNKDKRLVIVLFLQDKKPLLLFSCVRAV